MRGTSRSEDAPHHTIISKLVHAFHFQPCNETRTSNMTKGCATHFDPSQLAIPTTFLRFGVHAPFSYRTVLTSRYE